MHLIPLDRFWVVHIPFVHMVKLQNLAQFPVGHLAYSVVRVLYSFCANLLHSLIMWLIVSSLSPHNLHLLFCCVLSILALIWLVLMALFCAAVRRGSVSLLRFPFLSHVYIFSCKMSLVSRLKSPCSPSPFCFLVIVVPLVLVPLVLFLVVITSLPPRYSM